MAEEPAKKRRLVRERRIGFQRLESGAEVLLDPLQRRSRVRLEA
jgi:hypothetical protein